MFGNLFGKKKPKDKKNINISPEKANTKYHSIQILPCENSCDPASWISSKIYLVSELSQLPLKNCDKTNECRCQFKHYDDRRRNEERRNDSTILQNIFSGDEHREQKKRGRRNDD